MAGTGALKTIREKTAICRTYRFEAAHFLPNVHREHKCRRMHGHNYRVDIWVAGPVEATGFVMDFFDLDEVVSPLVRNLDHRVLNEVLGLENPTAELIAAWFFERLKCAGITAVRVYETDDCFAEVWT